MEDLKAALPADDESDFKLGLMLGSRKAFASVAGRCSAADAECLRRIRDEKLYMRRAATWEEFCPNHLGLSRAHANRIIHHLEEFGPDYFEIAQLTRVTPEQYRAIAPAIRDRNIHVDGQAIALIPENSDRVAAAVAALRQAAPAAARPVLVEERMAAIQRRFDQLAADYKELAACSLSQEDRSKVHSMLSNALAVLHRLELQRK